MIQEAIEKVQGLVEEGMSLQQLSVPGERPGLLHYFDRKRGEFRQLETEVGPRRYSARTLSEFAAMVKYFEEIGATRKPIVLVDMSGALAILDEDDKRQSMVQMNFKVSEPFSLLASLGEKARAFSQREMVWELRTTFKHCDTSNLLEQVRTIKFKADSSGTSTIKTGNERISSDVIAEVKSDVGAVPEETRFDVPVFEQLVDDNGETSPEPVECAIDVRIDKQEFFLRPLPGEIKAAKEAALSWASNVLTRLLGDSATVFLGGM